MWKGTDGLFLVAAVNRIRQERGCTVVQALRRAFKRDGGSPIVRHKKSLHGLSNRALQARYQEAAAYWALMIDRHLSEKQRAIFDEWAEAAAQLHKAIARYDEAKRRLEAVLHGGLPPSPWPSSPGLFAKSPWPR
jgi:hypothetical protein